MKINEIIQQFVSKAYEVGLIHSLDQQYMRNRIASLLQVTDVSLTMNLAHSKQSLVDLLEKMIEYAISKNVIRSYPDEIEQLESEIMNVVTPLPSVLNRQFYEAKTAKEATDTFYRISCLTNNVREKDVAKNIVFSGDTPYGEITITINLSKPEKTKEEILRSLELPATNYPICRLCVENEGYHGRSDWPARSSHRTISLSLLNEAWRFHYSPYAYYNEHSIFLSEKHEPMCINEDTMKRLLEIVELLPHYFVGSNAGLPIVGGSILGHNHYQGGRYTFPVNRAKVLHTGKCKQHPTVTLEVLHWAMSTIRLRSASKEELILAGQEIMNQWECYHNPECNIYSHTDGTPHNAITLIARRSGQEYEMDFILRNNRTTKEFPDGIFHPHQDVQHIKKENIGLIEAMGLAILPPRLEKELSAVRQFVIGEVGIEAVEGYHREWAEQLKEQWYQTNEPVQQLLEQAVVKKFQRVLEDASVFKQDTLGQRSFKQFAEQLAIIE